MRSLALEIRVILLDSMDNNNNMNYLPFFFHYIFFKKFPNCIQMIFEKNDMKKNLEYFSKIKRGIKFNLSCI